MIDWNSLPVPPPAPLPTTATDAEKVVWRDLHRISASYAQAWSQSELAAATDRYTTAAGKTTRADLIRAMVLDGVKPGADGSNGARIGEVAEFADDLIRAVPGIVD